MHSFGDVLAERQRFGAIVLQSRQAVLAGLLKQQSFGSAQNQWNADWLAWGEGWDAYVGSVGSVATPAQSDPLSALVLGAPDEAEWSTLMAYEQDFFALVARGKVLYPSVSWPTIPTGQAAPSPGWSPFALYPSLPPDVNATATSATWVVLALATYFYLGPLLLQASEGISAARAARRKA